MFFSKIQNYFKKDFKFDLVSGIIVGLIALPLAIAFAVASGARPEQGIYTSIIAGLVMGVLSGSDYQVCGPTGAFVVILLSIVNKFGMDGLLIAAFMAGVILLFMGIFKFGSVIKYIPYPVTVGFTAGIGLTIFSGEIKDLLGLHFASRPNDFVETIDFILKALAKGINLSSVIIAFVTLSAFLIWKKYNAKVPPAPVALLAGIVASLILSNIFKNVLPAPLVIGNIPAGLPKFQMLALSWDKVKLLAPSAFTIAILAAIESLLSAVVADGMTGTKHNSNRELISQGLGNMVLPLFGAIPATGAIARTAANIKNGARTRVSSIVHSFVLIFILLVGASYARYIPLAALAVILATVAYNMAEIPHFIRLMKAPKQDAFVLIVTFLLTVFVDLTVAVGVGIVLASVLFIQRASTLSLSKIDDSENIGTSGSEQMHASVRAYPKINLYELSGPLFFGVAAELENTIQHEDGEILILRMKHVNSMDVTAINALESIIDRIKKKNGHVYLATLHARIYAKLKRLGVIERLGGEEYVTNNTTAAIQRSKKLLEEEIALKK